ncbi:hypothetical protein C0993_010382 [Termitomyces sp. T159_Od127]|nr:hypothetical protein C0993_010382 [Termitomyces sp. T159_Od127]
MLGGNTIKAPKWYRTTSWKILVHVNVHVNCCCPYCLKKKQEPIKKTAAQKEEAKVKCDAQREAYKPAFQDAANLLDQEAIKFHEQFGGHTIQYYKGSILQIGCLKAKLANQKLKEYRANMTYGQYNVLIKSFNDATQSLLTMERYMVALHAQTGTEMMIIASRSSADRYLHPFAAFTSLWMRDFPFHQFKITLGELTSRFEAYSLAGVEGMVNKYTSSTAELKTKVKTLINSSLGKYMIPSIY